MSIGDVSYIGRYEFVATEVTLQVNVIKILPKSCASPAQYQVCH